MSLYKNLITLKGFLGKDAVQRTSSNQASVVVLSLATKSSYKDKQSGEFVSRTDWHRVVAFGKLAEKAKALTKGSYLEIEGELGSREYIPESGEGKRRICEVRARAIKQLERSAHAAPDNLDAESNNDEVPV
jgi:single-strand DNA-binding protein